MSDFVTIQSKKDKENPETKKDLSSPPIIKITDILQKGVRIKPKLSLNIPSRVSLLTCKAVKHLKLNNKYLLSKIPSLYSMAFDIDDIKCENIIPILQKDPLERSLKEIATVKTYLETTDLPLKFKKDHMEEESVIKLLYFCSWYFGYHYLKEDNILFRIGEEGDKFYLILDGSVSILKPIPKLGKMTAQEYINHLILLRDEKETYLLKLTISENMGAYPMDVRDISHISDILFMLKLRKLLISSKPCVEDLRKLFDSCEVTPKTYNIEFTELQILELTNLKAYYTLLEKLLSDINRYMDIYEKYKYIENNVIQRKVTLFHYQKSLDLHKGNYLGDVALDSRSVRTATIQTNEETHLGYLEQDIYNQYLEMEKKWFNQKEISFIIENYFFSPINKKTFEDKYFGYFTYQTFSKGDIISRENENVKCLYFIKEGDMELVINKSVVEIHDLINFLLGLKDWDIADEIYSQRQNEPKRKVTGEAFKKKKTSKILRISSADVLCVEGFYFEIPNLFQAKIISEKAKLYAIEAKSLSKILQEEIGCADILRQIAESKMATILTRLIDIENITKGMILHKEIIDFNELVPPVKPIDNNQVNMYKNTYNNFLNFKSPVSVSVSHPKLKADINAEEIHIEHKAIPQPETKDAQIQIDNNNNLQYNKTNQLKLFDAKVTRTLDYSPPTFLNKMPRPKLILENQMLKRIKQEITNLNKTSISQLQHTRENMSKDHDKNLIGGFSSPRNPLFGHSGNIPIFSTFTDSSGVRTPHSCIDHRRSTYKSKKGSCNNSVLLQFENLEKKKVREKMKKNTMPLPAIAMEVRSPRKIDDVPHYEGMEMESESHQLNSPILYTFKTRNRRISAKKLNEIKYKNMVYKKTIRRQEECKNSI